MEADPRQSDGNQLMPDEKRQWHAIVRELLYWNLVKISPEGKPAGGTETGRQHIKEGSEEICR